MQISIIITNYNYDKFVARAVRSAINQSYNKEGFEIIVVDDCSEDSSREIISSFGNQITPLFNDNNIGLAASCNKAIMKSRGTYVVRVDADDYIHKDLLKICQCFLAHNKDMNAVSVDYYDVDEKENIIGRRNATTWPIACGVMFRVDDLIELGLYNEKLPREDVEFRQRFLQSGRTIYNIPVPLYRYTQHNKSMTKKFFEE